VTKSAAKIRFEVEDTGIGMTPEQLTKIFLPFEQVGDNSRRNEGTGLGLAITQKIISIMGSKIFVESTPEVGSRFWFDLNLPIASSWMEPTSIKSSTPIIGYEGERRKLLIVDDRWENRSILIKMLEPIGFELIEAVNGQDGLEKAIEVQPDLIIADLVMPVMNGWEMARRLRELPQFQSITIIAISANAFEVDRQKSLEAGCNDFLPKPVQAEDLLNQIKNSLNLSWIYDSTYQYQLKQFSNESSYSQRATQSEIVIPPSSELVKLYQAAQSGKVQGVEHEIMRLQQLNPEYIAFAIRIMELAVDFEYEEIAQILEPYLS
ncbi:MAG TPA: hybrid sensor histidine kinase/response regulator, partial [Cyanobacteria bacterium UBA11148]|nr:hybrid sensor histidine kinase/response regulator [Cyanobacteria bacterium UBA11148]